MMLWLFLISICFGHEFRPGVLSVEEFSGGRVRVHWVPVPSKSGSTLTPHMPAHCSGGHDGPVYWLQCGQRGLVGEIGVNGSFGVSEDVVLRWKPYPSNTWHSTGLNTSKSHVTYSSASPGLGQTMVEAVRTGLIHIWMGSDHLLFIGLLVLLIGFSRRLVWVVTSFTAGHAAALIGFAVAGIRVSPLWVEPMIALTVAFMARECIVRAESAIPKTPVVIALGFGVIHGLGFSTAITDIGHSSDRISAVLFGFNVGIELGQLLFLVAIWGPFLMLKRWAGTTGTKTVAYCAGGLAVCWILQRVEVLWW